MIETGAAVGNVAVTEPTIHATLAGFSAFVGQVYTGAVATFTDDDPDLNIDDYTATINWGDGKVTAGVITPSNSAGQSFIVSDGGVDGVLHAYAYATTGQNPFVVTVTIDKTTTDSQGYVLSESGLAVGNVAVSLPTLHASFSGFSPVAGTTYSGPVATFTDDLPVAALENNPSGNANAFYSATIAWGDGTSSAGLVVTSNSAAGSFIVTGVHTYIVPTVGTSPFVVSVTILKIATSEYSVAAGSAAVADSLLFPYTDPTTIPAATEGSLAKVVVGSFVDTNPFVTAANFNGPYTSQTIINWGDGKSSVGTISVDPNNASAFVVTGFHTYVSPTLINSPNTLSTVVIDQWGGKTTLTNSIAVNAAQVTYQPTLTITTNPATAMPIVSNQAVTADIALFRSANNAATAGEYTATISWGDGTANDTGTVKQDGNGLFHVSGTHTYARPGVYNVMTTVLANGEIVPGGGAVLTSMITVVAAPKVAPRLK